MIGKGHSKKDIKPNTDEENMEEVVGGVVVGSKSGQLTKING